MITPTEMETTRPKIVEILNNVETGCTCQGKGSNSSKERRRFFSVISESNSLNLYDRFPPHSVIPLLYQALPAIPTGRDDRRSFGTVCRHSDVANGKAVPRCGR